MKGVKRKKKIDYYFLIVLILVITGFCFLLFPSLLNIIYKQNVKTKKDNFEKRVEAGIYNEDAVNLFDELYLRLERENELLYENEQEQLTDTYSYQTAVIDLKEYGIDDGIIGYITIPSIDIEMPIYLGANTDNMNKGAAHMTFTSYPIGGINTNTVIAAHRNSTKEMLRNIHKIKLEDNIFVTNFRETLIYKVTEIEIILPTDIKEIKIQKGKDYITLLTCDPIGDSYQRYVVFCERVME